MSEPIYLVSMARTPIGDFQGQFNSVNAAELGSVAIKAALERSGIAAGEINETIMGCVLPAGVGQAPARQASIGAGIPDSTGATTVNKMCGSGMKAIMLGVDSIRAGSADVVMAGGMESMSNAPYLLPKSRGGMRMGHGEVLDHMFYDGLEDSFGFGGLMGTFGEKCAGEYKFTRTQQDAFAIASLTRAQTAISDGKFKDEIAPVSVSTRKGEAVYDTDELPAKAQLEKIPTLRPAFVKDGTVTAANASAISDGAAAVLLMSASAIEKQGITPIGRIISHSTHAHDVDRFPTAPVGALQKVMDKTGWSVDDVDLFEVNEAFAVVPMAAIHDLDIPHDRLNIHGGACALGHPVGASGARIVVTLLSALKQTGGTKGVAGLCLGGGEAVALSIESVQ